MTCEPEIAFGFGVVVCLVFLAAAWLVGKGLDE